MRKSIHYDLTPDEIETVRKDGEDVQFFTRKPGKLNACCAVYLVWRAVDTCMKGDPEKYARTVNPRMAFDITLIKNGIDVVRVLKNFGIDADDVSLIGTSFVLNALKGSKRKEWPTIIDNLAQTTSIGSAERFACMLMRNKNTLAGTTLPEWVTSAMTPPPSVVVEQPEQEVAVEEEKVASVPHPEETTPVVPVVGKPAEAKMNEPVVRMEDEDAHLAPVHSPPAPTVPAKVTKELSGGNPKLELANDIKQMLTAMAEKLHQYGNISVDKAAVFEEETKRHEAAMRGLKEDQANALATAREEFELKLKAVVEEKTTADSELVAAKQKYAELESEFNEFKEGAEDQETAQAEAFSMMTNEVEDLKRQLADKTGEPNAKRRKTQK